MASVSNLILRRAPLPSVMGILRALNTKKCRGNPFQNGWLLKISPALHDDQKRSFSTHKIPTVNEPSVSTQRRFRSALPDEFYDDHHDKTIVSSSKPFLLADIGEGIAEVELLRWFVEEGQVISEFDPVCEVQSDKATVEITSRYDGKIHKLAYSSTGNMIKVGEPILWIETTEQDEEQHFQNESTEETPFESFSSTHEQVQATGVAQDTRLKKDTIQDPLVESSSSVSKKILTSPAVRKIARDNSLDLSDINGTGPSGRIVKGDVLAVVNQARNSVSSNQSPNVSTPFLDSEENQVIQLRGYNRIMADTMAASLTIPHMVYSDEINLNQFVKYKLEQQQLDLRNGVDDDGKKLLFLPLAVKAASKALEKYPWLNASFDESKYEATLWKDHNIGIAMDTPRGLIVPVIKQCQTKSLPEIAEELKRLKASVVEGQGGLPAEDLQGATFTLSNVGAIGGGGTYMSPIITPPQVAIGALGQIRRLPRFATPSITDPAQSQTIEEAHICAVSWAADHRVVDGATVARFHKSFKEYMEDPIKLLLELR